MTSTLAANDRYQRIVLSDAEAAQTVDFPVFDAEEITVLLNGTATSAWTGAGTFDSDGQSTDFSITMSSASDGDVLEFYGETAVARAEAIGSGTSLVANLNSELMRLTAIAQEIGRDRGRSVRVDFGDTLTVDAELPPIEGGKLLAANTAGTGFHFVSGSDASSNSATRTDGTEDRLLADLLSDGGLSPEDFGGTDETAIQAMMDWGAVQSGPVCLRFRRGANYTIGATISCDLPEGSVVDRRGARFTCTHNGVAFDWNAPATATIPRTTSDDNVTKRRIYVLGGQLTNTNATKTASVGDQAFFMRGIYFHGVYTTGFYAAYKFGGKDTYQWHGCFVYDCTRHYWMPVAGTLYTSSITGNDVVGAEWWGCHSSDSTDEAAIYLDNRVIGMKVLGGSYNGAAGPSVAHIYLRDNATLPSRDILIDTHMEGIGSAGAVVFNDAGGQGFYKVRINSEMTSATVGWKGVIAKRVNRLKVDSLFIDGSGGGTEVGVTLDVNCKKVQIDNSPDNFLSMATAVSLNSCPRSEVRYDGEANRLIVPSSGNLTIASGAITITGGRHRVDTEGSASTDDLATINVADVTDGMTVELQSFVSARDVVVKNGTGNISCGADYTLASSSDSITLRYDSSLSVWRMIASQRGIGVYTEGTFTPTIVGETTAGAGTYSTQTGRYTRIGNRVFFDVHLVWTAHTGTGPMRIGTLPYTVNASGVAALSAWADLLSLTANHYLTALAVASSTQVKLYGNNLGGGAPTDVAMDTAGSLVISGSYEVA